MYCIIYSVLPVQSLHVYLIDPCEEQEQGEQTPIKQLFLKLLVPWFLTLLGTPLSIGIYIYIYMSPIFTTWLNYKVKNHAYEWYHTWHVPASILNNSMYKYKHLNPTYLLSYFLVLTISTILHRPTAFQDHVCNLIILTYWPQMTLWQMTNT